MHPGDCAQRQVHPLAHRLIFLASLLGIAAVHGNAKSPGTPGRQQMDDWMAAQVLAGRNFKWSQLKSLYRQYKTQRTTDLAPDGTVQGPTPSSGGVGVVQDDYLPRLAARVHGVARSVAVAAVTQLAEHPICTRGPGWKLFHYVVEQNEAGLRDVVEDWVTGDLIRHSTAQTTHRTKVPKTERCRLQLASTLLTRRWTGVVRATMGFPNQRPQSRPSFRTGSRQKCSQPGQHKLFARLYICWLLLSIASSCLDVTSRRSLPLQVPAATLPATTAAGHPIPRARRTQQPSTTSLHGWP